MKIVIQRASFKERCKVVLAGLPGIKKSSVLLGSFYFFIAGREIVMMLLMYSRICSGCV